MTGEDYWQPAISFSSQGVAFGDQCPLCPDISRSDADVQGESSGH